MLEFYGVIFCILLTALLFVVVPFFKNKSLFSKGFFVIFSFVVIFSLSVYFALGSQQDLKSWLTKGRTHYALLEQVDELGGLDGMIARIEAKLKEHPDDVQGWFILGKLYLAKNDQEKAEIAFKKADEVKTQAS